ncbi:MAG: 2-dehydropantoate 2-reductase [Betaproteobacteria bacterium]|nr:MAG: 2-dehydropantoate 2-reductase [Betaproteobacteria bacterium]
MKFVIAGAGGVGGYLGVRLAQAGHEVAWLARGATLSALREQGIRLETPSEEIRLGPQRASNDAAAPGVVDAVIVTVKLYDLAAVAHHIGPLAHGTMVLPLQNGVEAHDILSNALPGARVLKGTVSTKSFARAPGHIVCKSDFCKIRLGGEAGVEIETLVKALNECRGVSAVLSPSIDFDLWSKFVMLASFSAVSCMARATIGEVLGNAGTHKLVIDAAEEAAAVGRALGIDLPQDIAALVDAHTRDMPKNGRPSMLEDLEAGRPLELEFLSGAVVRLGAKAGVPTPIHEVAYKTLSMHAQGGRQS